uniref:Uncharacterized protein n=1 Tax=Cacopsylla melanoneura TaxID=428564 RepID=A0A8D9AN10_9HEMI
MSPTLNFDGKEQLQERKKNRMHIYIKRRGKKYNYSYSYVEEEEENVLFLIYGIFWKIRKPKRCFLFPLLFFFVFVSRILSRWIQIPIIGEKKKKKKKWVAPI